MLVATPGQAADPGVLVQRFAIVASRVTQTNRQLIHAARARGFDAFVADPEEAGVRLQAGDVAVGRLDVLPTLDGPEPGIEALRALEAQGVVVLNRAGALLGAHDKLVTALRLGANGLPHPRTAHVGESADPGFEFPVVVKPRFGSWGKDVTVCRSRFALRRCLRSLTRRDWFQRQGAIVQELVAPRGHDLRIIVAGGEVVGAVERIAAPGSGGRTSRSAAPAEPSTRRRPPACSRSGPQTRSEPTSSASTSSRTPTIAGSCSS